MPRFKVTGKHADTGKAFETIIDAGNSLLARKRIEEQGVEVDRVEVLLLDNLEAEHPPNYTGLTFAAVVFTVIGISTWTIGLMAIVTAAGRGHAPDDVVRMALACIGIFVGGVFWLGLAAAFEALRNIALNTWHLRHSSR